ncbi:MAG: hypothetical protein ACREO4_14990 [Lysobacter sp.]
MSTMARHFREFLLAVAFFVAVAVAAIGANPFAGQTSTPLDLLVSYPGWGGAVAEQDVRHGSRSDALDARLPQWTYARKEVRAGRWPLWNDSSAGGDASLLKLTSGQLTPAFAIFTVAGDPAAGFYFAILFNLVLAGLGMYAFLRRHVAMVPALFGGLMFQLCGFTVAWLYWSHVLTLIWAPWLLWCVDGLLRKRSPGRLAMTAVVTAMLLLGGFPFVAELALGAAVLYAIVLAFGGTINAVHADQSAKSRAALAGLGLVMVGIAGGFFLAAIPLVTFVQWLDQFSLEGRGAGSFMRLAKNSELLFAPWAYERPRVESSMYVGTLGTLLACLGFGLVLFRRGASLLSTYSFLLALVAVVLTFQIVPVAALAWVPGLGVNGWSRAIALLDIALAISAAVALHWLLERVRTRSPAPAGLVVAVVLVALGLQTYDQLKYFRAFNGPTNSEYFYPETALLKRLTADMGPFDYAVADSSYLISGSLGGYGVREWFAHRFKTPQLNSLLTKLADDPFNSPTSSMLRAQRILTNAPEMGAMNVRYLLIRSDATPRADAISSVSPNTRTVPLPPLPEAQEWRQLFSVQEEISIRAVAIKLATYRKDDVDGHITLALLATDGTVLARARRNAEAISDNRYFTFELDQPAKLAPGNYSFRVRYRPGPNGRRVTAWAAPIGPVRSEKQGVLVGGQLVHRLTDHILHLDVESPFRKVMEDGAVSLWENSEAPKGPYFVGNTTELRDRDARAVRVVDYVPGHFTLRYMGHRPGFVVVPMELTPDWRVTVNGHDSSTSKVLDVLPAVPVEGPAIVAFEYRPRALNWFWPWFGLLAALAVGLVGWHVYPKLARRSC